MNANKFGLEIKRWFAAVATAAITWLTLLVVSKLVYSQFGLPWYLGLSKDSNTLGATFTSIWWLGESIIVAIVATKSIPIASYVAGAFLLFPTSLAAFTSLFSGNHGHYENLWSSAIVLSYGLFALFCPIMAVNLFVPNSLRFSNGKNEPLS